jgi:hypothetical protein
MFNQSRGPLGRYEDAVLLSLCSLAVLAVLTLAGPWTMGVLHAIFGGV